MTGHDRVIKQFESIAWDIWTSSRLDGDTRKSMPHTIGKKIEMATDRQTGKRILLVLPQMLFRPSGTPLNTLMMSRALIQQGYDVHILTIADEDAYPEIGYTLRGISISRLFGEIPIGFSIGKIFYNLKIAISAFMLLRSKEFDLVHAIEESAFYAVPIAHMFKVRAIADLDSDIVALLNGGDSKIAKLLAPPARMLRRQALKAADAAIAVNQHVLEIVRSENPNTSVYLLPDVAIEEALRAPDPKKMTELKRQYGLNDHRIAVYTGNLDRRQGVIELIDALPRVLEHHKDFKMLLVGGTQQAIRRLQEHAKIVGVDGAVSFAGQHPPAMMPEFMGIADLLVSPRLERYVTPLKIYSYMASRRPIVATDLPTHRDVLDQDSAILVSPTSEGLADGINNVLNNPESTERLTHKAADLLEERHSFENFQARLEEAYQGALGNQ